MCVLVHWGRAATTQSAVRALRAAHLPAHRLIVVENGMAAGVSARDACIVTLPENRGYAAAANVGIRHALRAGAAYVLVLNNDLEVLPGALEAMVSCARDPTRRVGCVGAIIAEGDATPVHGGGRVDWRRGRAQLILSPGGVPRLDYISGACMLLTRGSVEDVGGLPEDYFLYWEDVAYGFRLRQRGWQLAVARTPVLTHPRSGSVRDPHLKTYYLVRNGGLFVREYAPPVVRLWLLFLEHLRLIAARARGRWAVVHGLRDARRGVTGPLPRSTATLSVPP